MGGAFDEAGSMQLCAGEDVLAELNRVFGYPDSEPYRHAYSHRARFGAIQKVAGNYNDLIEAYEKAGVKLDTEISQRWHIYLKRLGKVSTEGPLQGPQNIYDIAQFRYNGLVQGQAMLTDVHEPVNGGHVHTQPGNMPGDPTRVSSPCPLPPT